MNRILHEACNAERILQITSGTLILMERDGLCVDISTQDQRWFLQEKQLLGKNIFELLPEVLRQEIQPLFQQVVDQQQKANQNYRFELSDKTYYFNCILHPYDGMILCQYSDISEEEYNRLTHAINAERMRCELQIKQLNHLMDTTMRNLPAGIVVKDIDNEFRYIYRNRKINNRDVSTEDVVGKNDFDFHPREAAEQKRKEDQEIARTGVEMHWIIEDVDSQGNPRIVDKRKFRVIGEDLSPIIISIEWDITQLELIKRELIREKENAETSDKLKSAFLANMSHEIRTPLNAIVGFSRIIAESEDADERKEYYAIVEANNERLLTLINEILDLSKIESGIVEFTIAPVNVNRLCQEIYDAHIFRCPQRVELVQGLSEEVIMIDSDKNRVFQVISNLIGNAFKFTTQGSISYGFKQTGDFIQFHVTDTGLGIEADKVGRVFERFMKANTFAQGTGLGLSICKTIIERLGGEISVESEIGKGTTFTFILPARTAKAKEAAAANEGMQMEETNGTQQEAEETTAPTAMTADTKVAHEGKKATILIAEDTNSNYQLLEVILGKLYHIEWAKDGMEVVTLFEEVNPDLILMDIKMPNLNGLEAAKIIRELSPTVPIIVQSAYAYDHDREDSIEAGCNDIISKPIEQDQLKALIAKYISRNASIN